MRQAKKKPAAKRYQRARPAPFQLYLSDEEKTNLFRKAAAKGCTASDYLRDCINREPRRRKAEPEPEPVDPRQITVLDIIEATP